MIDIVPGGTDNIPRSGRTGDFPQPDRLLRAGRPRLGVVAL